MTEGAALFNSRYDGNVSPIEIPDCAGFPLTFVNVNTRLVTPPSTIDPKPNVLDTEGKSLTVSVAEAALGLFP